MKRVLRFSKFFFPAAVFSILLIIAAATGFFVRGGFNLGMDFQAGTLQEVQFAPTAFSLLWAGGGNPVVFFDRNNLGVIDAAAGLTILFPFTEYPTLGDLRRGLEEALEDITFHLYASEEASSQWLVQRTLGDAHLGDIPYVMHYLNPYSPHIDIAEVREALSALGHSIAVQSLGQPSERLFMIRDSHEEEADALGSEGIIEVLEEHFGQGEVVILRSDFVGSRFARNLADQAALLIILTLLVMLLYVAFRFKIRYGVGLIAGIIHDGIAIVAFIIWTGMEFNITTIAAILTILGYSTNNTIIVFDRVRENLRIYPDEPFVNVLNISLTATLNRTIITTVTTMLAVMSLFIFTTGAMQDFALALMVGMLSGVYTTTFIVSGIVNLWEKQRAKKERNKLVPASGAVNMAASKA